MSSIWYRPDPRDRQSLVSTGSPAKLTKRRITLSWGRLALGAGVSTVDFLQGGAAGAGVVAGVQFQIPQNSCYELFALGVEPDLAAGVSNLNTTQVHHNGNPILNPIRTNHLGENSLPYGLNVNLAPMMLFGEPMWGDQPTIKYRANARAGAIFTPAAGLVYTSPVDWRALGIVYEGSETIREIYGPLLPDRSTQLGYDTFDGLSGGVNQGPRRREFFYNFFRNPAALVAGVAAAAWQLQVDNDQKLSIDAFGFCQNLLIQLARWDADGTFVNFDGIGNDLAINGAFSNWPFGDDGDVDGYRMLPEWAKLRWRNRRLTLWWQSNAAILANVMCGFVKGVLDHGMSI